MTSNWLYYCFTLLLSVFILSACLNSDTQEYIYSSDAQITSLKISSNQDSLKVLSGVKFSIDQVSSAPIIFNKDSLPYLFDVTMIDMEIETNRASGIKMHLVNPDSTFIWNKSDSLDSKKLRHIEVFAEDGKTSKTYIFQLRTHQQDPDTIFWQNVAKNYIDLPSEQITVSHNNSFFTYYKLNNSVKLSTSSFNDGEAWTNEQLQGLPQNVVLQSLGNDEIEGDNIWYVLDETNRVHMSRDGKIWTLPLINQSYSVFSIFGKMPSYTDDFILIVIKENDTYKFAKTIDFSTITVLNEVPQGFPVYDFTSTTIIDPLNYNAKYLITTGGKDNQGASNNKVWILQEDENELDSAPVKVDFNVKGSSLFHYDDKIYLMVSEEDENAFYTSNSNGVFWTKANSKQSLPSEFVNRKSQSVLVDDKNFIWIFGGISEDQDQQLVEAWKGRINKLYVK